MLNELRETAPVVIGNSVPAFEKAAATAMSSSTGRLALSYSRCVPDVTARPLDFIRAQRPRGRSSRKLIASDVVMTNGSGVSARRSANLLSPQSLYFAKDFRRMNSQSNGCPLGAFRHPAHLRPNRCIVGYGDIGRAVASRVRAVGMNVLAVKRHPQPK